MRSLMPRRHLVRMAAGVIGTVIGSGHSPIGAKVPACYWTLESSKCIGGTFWEQWCYRCCDDTGCENASCEWHEVGPC